MRYVLIILLFVAGFASSCDKNVVCECSCPTSNVTPEVVMLEPQNGDTVVSDANTYFPVHITFPADLIVRDVQIYTLSGDFVVASWTYTGTTGILKDSATYNWATQGYWYPRLVLQNGDILNGWLCEITVDHPPALLEGSNKVLLIGEIR